MKNKKRNLFALLALLILIFTSACSNAEVKDSTTDTKEEKKQITVATFAMPKPFTYVDENGELVGYDIDVVRAIGELLPQYEIKFEKTEFSSMLAGLDSGRYQVAANNLTSNPERAEKYLFSEPIFENKFGMVVKKGRTNIQTLSDLGRKSVLVLPGNNYHAAVEKYNENHPDNKIDIKFSEQDVVKVYQDIETGLYDSTLDQGALFNQYQESFGYDVEFVPLSDEESNEIGIPFSYLFFGKGEQGEQIKKDFDGAIKQLSEDGTLSEISKKYFGDDFSPK